MNAPQVVMIVLLSTGLLLAARDHGKPRSPENFWTHFASLVLVVALLWWGGFWR